MTRPGRAAIAFIGIGLLIYAAVYFAAERLMYRNGHSNPFFKIATANEKAFDWVILGASHAMPLDFADFNDQMQSETSLKIINLALPGTGPLYHRFVLEAFLREHTARNVLYVVDSFAFYSRTWNEDRFGDAKLLRATPFDPGTAWLLWQYSRREGVDPRAAADYLAGFSKINNRDRFKRDAWEGELQFDRAYRPSAVATKSRIAYLFPNVGREAALARYLTEFTRMLELAKQRNVRVVVIKMPTPGQFRALLPNEAAFDEAMTAASHGIGFKDLSLELDEPRFYSDTDHLNRVGVTELFARHLKAILTAPTN
ncbi:hypothetical protein KMZ93_20265 [Bradyrhizobium sediminis]|uniref:Uncharacterized protein n=1 Tax=Bradyrhizobium sediminis TaxID=2840469 RepID=A0A975RWN4_9BRAD|nr:hypothetical protein [Bradyrhizobium sediminis]QWG22288.1 hypothetical protein KMZ93_20265 [Bradyrhizobium sediminis]